MLLTITTTARPATDLGFLLHKHPERVQEFGQSFGTATVFYPEAGEERCTAALLLEVDPIALVRSRGKNSPDFSLSQYVNDRPYAASSLLAVALADVFRTARAGRCTARPELPGTPLPLELRLPALPCRGGPELARRLFEPLGWAVEALPVPLDEGFPEWGESRYVRLTLRGSARLSDALNHLYVLLPVLDDGKHYWVAPDEVDKLIRAGEGWLGGHPERGLITRRYLGRRWALARTALARLAELGDETEEQLEPAVEEDAPVGVTAADEAAAAEAQAAAEAEGAAEAQAEAEGAAETATEAQAEAEGAAEAQEQPGKAKTKALSVLRREAILAKLEELGAVSVLDLGCGQGELVGALLARPRFARVGGMDVSPMALTIAARKLRLERMPDAKRARLTLFQGALTYTDKRLSGYDAAVLMEVIEHVDPPRLAALERVVFGRAKPGHVLVTTPNIEYNVRYEFLTGLRHPDHRFEWTREEFRGWATRVADQYGYQVAFAPVGDDDPEVGPPTQMGVFTRDQRS
ncbi:3' terminal RNA ribose 2'-O-methyltransferase Hen1 [Nonomuraea gerenzanensis]|uniref:Small RNA 2'-O-methyltransferase n=1 Tax=Nonomuraea gerenzanensis TaxID=93944 RepID=A0A1M4EK70_9ACTN|nr:3' terminal RNA ribose 2'-O-methyltransferase Hen1 [Nonomuraea gerenzanensis]UBU10748.1 3' terminal RNA ribose 2'-O-methyltransferase Hen1 [Nonomuraea gerenzanensis]SBO99176.1 HEN1 C-terminal domain; double-stranded RNA 3'-methylase [Nonomuraea gerenzanensis]